MEGVCGLPLRKYAAKGGPAGACAKEANGSLWIGSACRAMKRAKVQATRGFEGVYIEFEVNSHKNCPFHRQWEPFLVNFMGYSRIRSGFSV
ncbi:hypothetical protein AS888_00290 [Peribacillus simplex]|uniref:Uncharacterized protein n=1 Tax=Peribacillus simplex TaxID=1478 RepID=A0A109MU53_9BACI|nr:hypothetical protein AS888_00290 [Peribacillus simplex]